MERFDDKGKLVTPDRAIILAELKQHGLHMDDAIHIHQAFCPNGHQLIMDANTKFDGLPGVKLLLRGTRGEDAVFMSPVLNKRMRSGGGIFALGDRLDVLCPVCGVKLPVLAPCDCQWNGEYVMLSLGEDATRKNAACFCNIWGCPMGDIRLAGEVITDYQRQYEL